MKHVIFIVILLAAFGSRSSAQEISIDPYMFMNGYFDNLDEAKEQPDSVKYLALSMQHPKLKEIPEVIYSFKNLIRLDVSFNQVASVGDGIGKLTQLEYLNLEGNHYLTKVSDMVTKLPSLKELILIDARIPAADLEALIKSLPESVKVTTKKQ
jgi:Leucine-rich repeat (LRR) protein